MKVPRTRSQKRTDVLVAITGHRPNRLPASQYRRVRDQLSAVMASIERDYPGEHMLLTGLAEGADRLAATIALGRGWRLHAVLAFDRVRFEQDFPEPYAMGEFRALLASASRTDEPARSAFRGKPAKDAYNAVGAKLVAQGRLLIAIWDGAPSEGKGGTVDVIEEALSAGLPVVWIHATKAKPPEWLSHGVRPGKRARPLSEKSKM